METNENAVLKTSKEPGFPIVGVVGLVVCCLMFIGYALSVAHSTGDRGAFAFILLVFPVLCVYLYSVIVSFSDAKRRGKPAWLVALFVALVPWPIGWIAWLIFRPSMGIKK